MATEMLKHQDYKVGWICAVPKEQTAAIAMLDHPHPNLPKPPKSSDSNTYTLGSIGGHNIVIACLPKGKHGTISATAVATNMATTFPNIRFFLMVGIGSGIPPKVRLGDVVVSVPTGSNPGVIQWDMGKAEQGGAFVRTGALNNPPMPLLTALSTLESEQKMNGSKMPEYLDELANKYPRLAAEYLRSDSLQDVLFKWNYDHVSKVDMEGSDEDVEDEEVDDEPDCRHCDKEQVVTRQPREMKVHYGLIASGNQVIEDARRRRSLVKELGNALCIEMEAAGLMVHCPCIVIRGICDYADSHKNKAWHGHAAAVAAAFAKELLGYVVPEDVDREKMASDILSAKIDAIKQDTIHISRAIMEQETSHILSWLSDDNYDAQQNDNLKRWHPMTGQWFLNSKEYQEWLITEKRTLYCPGIPGAGKTIMTSAVIHDISQRYSTDPTVGLAYVYFTYSRQQEQTVEHILASLLMQLLRGYPSLPNLIQELYQRYKKSGIRPTSAELSETLTFVVSGFKRSFIVLDALDECPEGQCRTETLSEIMNLQARSWVNVMATSRMHDEIASRFNGRNVSELLVTAYDKDMSVVLHSRMKAHNPNLFDEGLRDNVTSKITKAAQGMFLLVQLYLQTLFGLPTKGDIKDALRNLTQSTNPLEEVYQLAMERIQSQGSGYDRLAKRILLWIVHSRRPMSIPEIQHALAVKPKSDKFDPDYLPSVEILKSICVGLVMVDKHEVIGFQKRKKKLPLLV